MTHLWVRAEQRLNEERVGLMPVGAKALIEKGIRVSVEESSVRAIPLGEYQNAGADIVPENSWPDAPADAIIFGLKELPDDGGPLSHRHIMFGHAYKGQPAGRVLLNRLKAGGGELLDLEYLVDENGRRVAAFGYWAGFAGAAVALKCWVAQQFGGIAGPVGVHQSSEALCTELERELSRAHKSPPTVLIIGALGRVGTGAKDLCTKMGIAPTRWDMAETASGGPFQAVLEHDIFLNCIFASPGTPVFVPAGTPAAKRNLSVIGDIACDPDSEFSPIKVYDRTTSWEAPALRVHDNPPLDVTAIDNLPSMLPVESSEDYSRQLLPSLLELANPNAGVWTRAHAEFDTHVSRI
jgi:saccharopine dehydrogenase (NAD+, L-lysine-forming)